MQPDDDDDDIYLNRYIYIYKYIQRGYIDYLPHGKHGPVVSTKKDYIYIHIYIYQNNKINAMLKRNK
jgi:hypothetical protein